VATAPSGFAAGGLPTSLQIVCRAYAEPLASRIGPAYQAAHDWHHASGEFAVARG
jgi:aspartyl-tRNA(Asn)/glutamyl-tRNA(Gln) amidotransferase subunit A